MPTECFSLQVEQHDKPEKKTRYHVARSDCHHTTPHVNAQWQRYKVTVDGDKLVGVEITDKLLPPQKFTLESHAGKTVKIHSLQPVMGTNWRKLTSTNEGVRKLLDFMRETLPEKGKVSA